jgi:SAM-dependent methyltransferase
MPRKTQIKIADAPQIAVCVPIGAKYVKAVMKCPEEHGGCGQTYQQLEGVRAPNLIPFQFLACHMNLQQPLNTGMTYFFESGRLSAEARQIMTKNALRLGAKYILYWDDDTLPPQLGLYTLHNWMERHPEAGAISGVYTTRHHPNEPLIYTAQGKGAAWDFEMGPGAEPEPILGGGAGFLLARASAIEKTIEYMTAENGGTELPIWSDENDKPETGRAHFWGHDMRFCRLLNEWGFPVYVHGEVLCDHYDITTGETFRVPPDAPGFQKCRDRNINTKAYWDNVYGNEGANTWRTYPEMFDKVTDEVVKGFSSGMENRVAEVGCGVGILGSKLVAEHALWYKGFDISAQAVAFAKARFLDCEQKAVKDLTLEDLKADVIVATELMEHLDEADYYHMLGLVQESRATKFIFTVPDDCMGPEEVPEHTALFNEALVRERHSTFIKGNMDFADFDLRVEKADDNHLIVVMER